MIKSIIKKFLSPFISCATAMGGISVVHFTTAAKTGGLGCIGILAATALIDRCEGCAKYKDYITAVTITSVVAIADWLIHPAHFGYEGVVTGAIAAGINYVLDELFKEDK